MAEVVAEWVEQVQDTFEKLRLADREVQERACLALGKEGGAKLREMFAVDREAMDERAASLDPFGGADVLPKGEKPKTPAVKAKVEVVAAKPLVRRSLSPTPKLDVVEAKRTGLGDKGPLTQWPEEWPKAPPPPAGAVGYERLLYPKGLLGHAVQYVVDTAGLPDRKLSLGVALSALAKGMDRKVIGPSGNSTILYILLIAETGAGKQHGLGCVRSLLRAMGIEQCYAASGLASVQAIEEIIEGVKDKIDPNPNALVVIDEVGSWLTRIMGSKQVGNVAEIPAHLQIMWGQQVTDIWMSTKNKGKEMGTWYSVAFGLVGFSTEKAFFGALKDRLLGSGFVNRMLLFNVGRGAEERVDAKYSSSQCPEWLVGALRRVTNLDAAPLHGPITIQTKDGGVVTLSDFYRMEWTPQVKEACRKFEKETRGMPSVEDREIWIRAHDIAIRLATVHAFYRCSRVVEIGDWMWAAALARHSTQELKWGVDKHMTDDLIQADLAECIREFAKSSRHRCVTIGEIHKLLERKTSDVRTIDHVLWHVVKTGDIVEVPREQAVSDARGKPTTYFRWGRR